MTRQKRQTKESVHYVNNKEFTAAIIEHNRACKLAETEDKQKPRVSEYIGEFTRLQLGSLQNQTLLTIHIVMK